MNNEQKAGDSSQPESPIPPAGSTLPQTRPAGPIGVQQMGMAPTSFEEGWRLAQILAKSELVPKPYQQKPADILVAIQYGMELGFPPMQALQSIAVINGKPGVYGDGFLALLTSSPLCREHDEYYEVPVAGGFERRDGLTAKDLDQPDTAAVCAFWRAGKSLPVIRRFSVGQAKKAALWGKQGPWQQYPDRMLMMRARGFAGRDAFPDLLRGIKTAEELADTPPDDDVIDLAGRSVPVQPRRASEARPATESSSATPAPANGSATAAPAASPATTQELRGLTITHTAFVRPRVAGIEPYYEITAKTSSGEEKTFLTRAEPIYKDAAACEGTDCAVAVEFRRVKKGDEPALELVRLATSEPAAPAAENGALFG